MHGGSDPTNSGNNREKKQESWPDFEFFIVMLVGD